MNDSIAVFMAVCLVIFLGFMANKVWTLGANEDDYKVICLGGHQYWRANFAAKGFLAVKLNGDGTPAKCK